MSNRHDTEPLIKEVKEEEEEESKFIFIQINFWLYKIFPIMSR